MLNNHFEVLGETIEAVSDRNGSLNLQSSKLGSSAHPGKVELHALGGVCAGEARVAAQRASQTGQLATTKRLICIVVEKTGRHSWRPPKIHFLV